LGWRYCGKAKPVDSNSKLECKKAELLDCNSKFGDEKVELELNSADNLEVAAENLYV
jgi:hypothetical protein